MKFLKNVGIALAVLAVWSGLTILSLIMIVRHPKNAWADLQSMRHV